MSKKTKSVARLKRRQQKAARRDQKKALYAQYAKEGRRKGSKRARKRGKNEYTPPHLPHPEGHCGNVGCDLCYPKIRGGMAILEVVC